MSPDQEKDFTHVAWSGLRNNVSPTRFGLTDLVSAVNVDIDDSGVVRRRQGYGSPVIAGAWHSLWSNGRRCFGVTGTTLREILPDYSTVTLASVTASRPVCWLEMGARIFWSNGVERGCITGTNRSWGLAVPRRIDATAMGGSLRAGRYQFAMTFLREDGQESGAPSANVLELSANSGLQFSNLPVSADPTVDRKVIYVSESNGETLYRAAILANATTTHTYRDRGPMSVALATQFLGPAPAATALAFHGGSVLSAVGNLLYYSEPFAPELFDMRRSFAFPSAVTLVAAVDKGVYVGTETGHFWLGGDDPTKYVLEGRGMSAAIRGTLSYLPERMFGESKSETDVAVWHTSDGIVTGDQSGAIANLTSDRFLFPGQPQGSSVGRTERGINQFVSLLQGTETPAPAYT